MIMTGQSEIMVAGGIEMMTHAPKMTDTSHTQGTLNQWLLENEPDVYMPMGLTAERVAEKFNITRQEMDELAVRSHQKAYAAQQAGKFDNEIIPIEVTR
jgi:acetyl-CoA acyltransferase